MKTNRFCLILGLMAVSVFFCSKKDKTVNPDGNTTGNNITVNQTAENPYGLDSLYVSPTDSMLLQVATVAPLETPDYQWTVGNNAVFQLVPDPGDASKVTVVAVGDSGATTTINVKDLANNQEKTLSAKVAVWANMQRFRYAGSLNRHHYFVSTLKVDWATAKGKCEESNGHLVAITSKEENDIAKHARDMVNEDVWIGLHFQFDLTSTDRNKDLKWTLWVTGEPVVYKNWASGKPDFTSYNQDWDTRYFGYMDAMGKWVNSRAVVKYYVLEIP